MPNLRDSVDSLFLQKEDAEFHINRIQNEVCSHPKEMLNVVPMNDGENQYWKNITCGICRKFWMEDSHYGHQS